MQTLTIADVWRARTLLAGYLPPTPTWSYPALDELAGADVRVKHENVQPTGAFKVRGGLTLLAGMPAAERARGVVTWSTGNHAQSIAYASRVFGNRCVVVMPEGANENKVRAVQGLGGTVLLHGTELGEAQEYAQKLAETERLRPVSPAGEAALLAGVGTAYLELFEAAPGLDFLVVPVGSGTGAAAACVVAAALAPGCQVIGVQSARSPAAYDSWRTGTCVRRPNRTAVDGLATGAGFAFPQRLMRTGLADFVLVSDLEIDRARRLLATHAHTLAEGAGSAALAAVLADPQRYAGRKVAIVCSGGNASPAEIAGLADAA
ncbi:MAG: threonine dehydratase [Actinobacteria bacterium 13_2_20CM_2_71_6]|nr:MAG: threonine dehydratase [Actinobacteria bacterium 13_2_20CM_2_71_6]